MPSTYYSIRESVQTVTNVSQIKAEKKRAKNGFLRSTLMHDQRTHEVFITAKMRRSANRFSINLQKQAGKPVFRNSWIKILGTTLSNAPAMSRNTATVEALLRNAEWMR